MPLLNPDAADRPGTHDGDKLETRVWLRLLACTSVIENALRRRLRQDFATTLPRFDVLAQLDRVPAGLSMGELSRRLMVTNGNITGLIERLAGDGLVERLRLPSDRRTVVVRITSDGKRAFDAMTPAHALWLEEIFADLDRDDMQTLCRLLDGVKAATAGRHDADAETDGVIR